MENFSTFLAEYQPLDWIILGGFFCCVLSLIWFYFHYYRHLIIANNSEKATDNCSKGVSIIISGENEFENLKSTLNFWLTQQYECFEVVIVYDTTDLEIVSLLHEFQQRYSNLKIVNFSENVNFFDIRRFAVSIGIKSAEYDYVLVSTADTRPLSEYFLKEMMAKVSDTTDVVLSYSCYEKQKSFVNALNRYFLFIRNLQMLSFALRGNIFGATRHNILYKKEFFLARQSYISSYSYKTGSYDILNEKDFSKSTIAVCFQANGTTKTDAKFNFGTWLKGELEYLCLLRNTPLKSAWILFSHRFSLFLFYPLFLLGILNLFIPFGSRLAFLGYEGLYAFGILILLKYICQVLLLKKCAACVSDKQILSGIPFFELLYLPLQLILFFAHFTRMQKKWK